MRTEWAARVFVFGLLAVTLYLLFLVFKPFLPGIAWAIFLATAFHPVYSRLVRLLRGREWAAAIITTTLVAALIVMPAIVLVSSLARTLGGLLPELESRVRQTRALAVQAQEKKDEERASRKAATPEADRTLPAGAAPGAGAVVAEGAGDEAGRGDGAGAAADPDEDGPSSVIPFVAEIEKILGPYVDVAQLDLEGVILASVKRVGQALAQQTSSLLQNALRTVIAFLIMIFTMVVLFREGSRFLAACKRLLPLRERDKEEVFQLLHEVTRAVFYGVMMTALVQAIIGTVGWMVVGLPAPMTFGIAMFFCALIPIGGTSLVWGPGALYLFLQGHPIKALVLLGWGFLFVGLIDNFLRPIFISGRTRMHTLLVFFGILGGITAFGFAGLFLGPLVITLALFLLEVVRRDLLSGEAGGASPSSPKPAS